MTMPGATQPWLRKAELLIGPIAEWRMLPNTAYANQVRIVSDGSLNTLRLRFNIRKHCVSTAQPSLIHIYNLSQPAREALNVRNVNIVLRAGWENTGMVQIFSGGLQSAWSYREGADIVTTLSCISGKSGLDRTTCNRTFTANYSVHLMVYEIAQMIPGITVDPGRIKIGSQQAGPMGLTVTGLAADILNRLGRMFCFSWHVVDGVFEAKNDDLLEFKGVGVTVSSNNGFLKRIEPMLRGPFSMLYGVHIQTLLHPLIQPWEAVNVISAINPELSGTYQVQTVSHNGDTYGNQWDTDIECLFTGQSITIDKPTTMSSNGVKKLTEWEGGNITYKHDVLGVPHIGVGHKLTTYENTTNIVNIKGVNVNIGSGITTQQGLDLFAQDRLKYEAQVNRSVQNKLNQNQYDALVSLCYNIGPGGFAGSTVVTELNNGNYSKVPNAMRLWNKAGGVVIKDLVDRREAEIKLWNS